MLPAFLLLAAPPAGLPAPVVGEGLGVALGFADLAPADEAALRATGIRIARRDLFWHEVESRKGVYEFARWDRLLDALARAGVRPMLILCYGNDLYEKGAPRSPEARAAFVRFARAAVARYAGRGVIWEMWNEPNGAQYWAPSASADEYATLAKEVTDLFERDFPAETLVGPGLAGVDLPYLEALGRAGLLKRWAGVTVHPYRPMEPETVGADVARVRELLARYGAPGKPVLSGEWGYSARENDLGEEKQGDYAPRMHLALLAAGVPMTVWYGHKDDGPAAPGGDRRYGLFRPDGTPKPAALALKDLTAALGGFRFDKRILVGDEGDRVLLFRRGDRPGVAAWTLGAPRDAEPIPGWTVKLGARPQYWVPQRRSRLLDLALSLPAAPPSIRVEGPADVAKLVRSFQASLPPGGKLEARWIQPGIGLRRLELRAGELGSKNPIERYAAAFPRTPDPIPVRLVVTAEAGTVTQETLLTSARPLSASLEPTETGGLVLRVRAVGGFDGTVRLLQGERTYDNPLKIVGDGAADVPIPDPDEATIAVLKEGDRSVAITEALRRVVVPTAGWRTTLEGEPAVYGKATLSDSPPREGRPGGVRVEAKFNAGWKYALGTLPEPFPVPGRPREFGAWVEGDGSGALLLMRFEDAAGTTYQPEGVPVDWTGWRYVRFSMRGDTGGRWGGDGTGGGRIRLPVRITAPFVLDNPGGKGVSTNVVIAQPSVTTEIE